MAKITTQEMTTTISKRDLCDLLITQEKMRRLEGGGVDNWEWYGESLNPDGEPDMDEAEEQIRKDVDARA